MLRVHAALGRGALKTFALAGLLAMALAGGGLVVATEPAIASSPLSWASPVRADDQPPFAAPGEIKSVSCPSSSLCFAVDNEGDVLSSTDPRGGTGAWRRVYLDSSEDLGQISCPSTALCVVVGGSGHILTSTEPTGSAWTAVKLGEAAIREVSCPSTSLCVAVDSKGDVITSTDPAGGAAAWTTTHIDTHESFTGISCPTTSLCVAGTYEGYLFTTTDPTGGVGAWTVSHLEQGDLLAVSCSSESLCVLTDNYGNAFVSTEPTAGTGAWKVTHVSRSGLVEHVSCASWGLCIALAGNEVITSLEPTGGEGAWTSATIELKNKYGGTYSLDGVACPAAGLCVLVDDGGAVLTSTEPTGGASAWTVTLLAVGRNGPWEISCASESLCVGADEGGNVVVSTNPTSGAAAWTTAHVDGTRLNGVSCPSAGFCAAVDGAGNVVTSSEPTGGPSAWSTANVDGAIPFYGVSCPSTSLCVAIDREGDVVASIHPTGGSGAWSVFPVPHTGTLAGVSCPSEQLCVAVDNQGDVITSTNPAGGTAAWTEVYTGVPRSISCPSTKLCVAAGGDRIVSSNNPTGGPSSWTTTYVEGLNGLEEVSCAQGGSCVATSYGGNGSPGNVVVSSDATGSPGPWIESNVYGVPIEAPNPNLSLYSVELTGVSCVAEGMCAVTDIQGRVMIGLSLPNRPTVETKPANSITGSTATLNATVNPNGGEVTKCEFEYGTKVPYEKHAPCSSLPGSGTSPVAVSAGISGLAAHTVYHFRIVATNTSGTSEGADETFQAVAPSVETKQASSITGTSATLNAVVNPNGGTTECKFEYTTQANFEFDGYFEALSVPCASSPGSGTIPVAVSASITGLSPTTTYHFRIVATNASGTSYGPDMTFTTLGPPPTAVTQPASEVTATSVMLNATVNPNGSNVTKCEFEYGIASVSEKTAPCASLPGSGMNPVAVSANISGLATNSTYHFRISATNAGGTGKGSEGSFKTPPIPPTPTTKPATEVTLTSATLNATVNPNGGEVTQCEFEYGTKVPYEKHAPCSSLPGSGTSPVAVSAAVSELSPSETYHFRISASNPNGTSYGSDVTFRTTAPPAVVTVSASQVTKTTATLNATVNPRGETVSKCEFQYGTTIAYGSFAPCSSLPGSGSSPVAVSASVTGLTAKATYHFRIVATNEGGSGEGSDQSFITANPAHYFSGGLGNGARVEGGERVATIEWGTLSLTNLTTGAKVTCHNVIGAVEENPEPGGETGPAGSGETQSFDPYDCESEACNPAATGGGPATYISVFAEGSEAPYPATGTATMTNHSGSTGTTEEPLVASGYNLKWKNKLIEEGTKIRQETEKIKDNVICHVETAANAKGEPEYGAQVPEVSKGNNDPLTMTHCCTPLSPPELEFDAGTHTDENEVGQRGRTEGKLKVLGYGGEEVINAKEG